MTKKERRRKSDANKLHMLNIINKLFWLISLIYIVAQTYMLFAIGQEERVYTGRPRGYHEAVLRF